jgi:hypothetical protein
MTGRFKFYSCSLNGKFRSIFYARVLESLRVLLYRHRIVNGTHFCGNITLLIVFFQRQPSCTLFPKKSMFFVCLSSLYRCRLVVPTSNWGLVCCPYCRKSTTTIIQHSLPFCFCLLNGTVYHRGHSLVCCWFLTLKHVEEGYFWW